MAQLLEPAPSSSTPVAWYTSSKLMIALGIYTAIYWIWLLSGLTASANASLINNLAYLPPGMVAAILAWQAGKQPGMPPQRGLAWRFIGLAFLADSLGNLLWLVFENILGLAPFPSWADALYLASYPLLLAGVVLLAGSRRYRSAAFWLDATIIVGGGGMVLWYLVLSPTVQLGAPSFLIGALALAYPMGSLLHLFAIATIALHAARSIERHVATVLVAALTTAFIADMIYGVMALNETYSSGHWVDGIYMIHYGFIAWAAQLTLVRPLPESANEETRLRFNPVPYLSAAAGYGMLISVALADWGHPLAKLAVGAALLAMIGAIRLFLTRRENLRLHAERAERAAEVRFQALVQHATDIILILDADGSPHYASPAAERILGYRPDQMPALFSLINPEQRRHLEQQYAALLQTHGAAFTTEARLRHADGSWRICVITWRNLIAEPYVAGVVAVCHDITARAEAEAALRESETSLRTIIETAPVGISAVGPDERFDLVNPALCRLLGYTPEELFTKTVADITHPEDYRREQATMRQLSKNPDSSYSLEKRYIHKDGRVIWVSLTGAVICDPQGVPLRGMAIVLDIGAHRAAEDALRRTQSVLQSFIDHAPLMIALYDAVDGRYISLNNLHADGLGQTPTELLGECYVEFVPPEIAALWQAEDAQIRESGLPLQVEGYIGSGTEGRTLLITKFPIFNDDRIVSTIGVIAKDITERKQAEEALRESHAFLQATLDSLSAHIAILNAEGAILTVNAAWQAFGMANGGGDSIGSNYLNICAAADDETAVTARATVAGILAVRDGVQPTFTLEYPCPSPEEARWFMLRVTRFSWENTVRIVVAHENITARKLAEHALQSNEARLRTLVQHIPGAAVLLFDHELRFLVADGQALSAIGFSQEQLEGRTLMEVLPQADADWLAPFYRATLRGEPPPDQDLPIQDRIFHTRFVPIRNTEGSVVAGMILSLDITQLRRDEAERLALEQRLQATQRLESIGTLAGGVAHDFNNLLQSVLGHAELLRLDLTDESPLLENVDAIRSGAEQAATLTGQLLAYSGKGRFLLRPLNLNSLIPDVVELSRRTLHPKAQVHLHLDEPLPTVEADAGQARQIVLNLLLNASEALPEEGGVIQIETADTFLSEQAIQVLTLGEGLPAGRYVRLTVRDTGHGMDDAVLARIFEPFFSTKFAGRGLGLAAVHGIVRSHRGAIELASAPGRGTTISIWLPAFPDKAAGSPSTPPTITSSRGTLLIIDDEAAVRRVARQMLERLGYHVREAADGPTGLRILAEHAPDVVAVLLDLTMPELNGDVIAQQIARDWPNIAVLLMSGFSTEEIRAYHGHLPVNGILQKPFNFEELRKAIAQLRA